MGLFGIGCFSLLTTGAMCRYSLQNGLMDVPNERSLHLVPTPLGGGVPIVLAIILSVTTLYFTGRLPSDITLAIFIGGLFVSTIGWIDDHRHIPPLQRILGYIFATLCSLYFLDASIPLDFFGINTLLPTLLPSTLINIAAYFIIVLGVVWFTNLYNFMDGVDGQAATQAVCTGLLAGFFFWHGGQQGIGVICFSIAIASAGFVFWNWPPAKIFMGDAGSCTLGFYFALLAILGQQTGSVPFIVWFILLSLFIWDATLTLLMRIFKRERWYKAHTSHGFQRLLCLGYSPLQLAIKNLLINIFLLWPAAWIAWSKPQFALGVALLVAGLIIISWTFIQLTYERSIRNS